MTQVTENTDLWLAKLSHTHGDGTPVVHPWLERFRKNGIDRFAATGLPSHRHEEWRHTNLAPLSRIPFRAATGRHSSITRATIAAHSIASEAAIELVFVDGFYTPELSTLRPLDRGARAVSLADAIENPVERVENYLGRFADIEANPFTALNTGFFRDGAYVHVPRGVAVNQPIHLLFLSTASAEPTVSHPRVLIVAEDTAEASVVETYASTEPGVYLTNAVTEIFAGNGARVEHCKVQQESTSAFHIGTTQVQLGRAGNFLSHSASLGASISRNDLNVVLSGTGAEAMLNGITLIGEGQHADNHTLLDHREPRCPSHELYKAVLDGKASGVFKGKILVHQAAQKTDSKQSSRTLLLSDDAVMYSQPALEIYADDVKCTHGSTTGPVDEEQIFYLRSRGVSLEAARHLLTYAFLADVTGRIRIAPVRRRLEEIMAARHGLPKDLRIQTQ